MMKSPLQDKVRSSNSLACLKRMIPEGSIVSSYLFFAGNLELGLANDNRFIIAHTNKSVIYDFWKCVELDAKRVLLIAQSFLPIKDQESFQLFQDTWTEYNDPYIRSALLFLLNRASKKGTVSAGEVAIESFNPLSFIYLESLNLDNFHIVLEQEECHDSVGKTHTTNTEILLIPSLVFSHGLPPSAKTRAPEEYRTDHIKLFKTLRDLKRKWILVYNKHSEVLKLYNDYNTTMIDKHGRETTSQESCKELIIANF